MNNWKGKYHVDTKLNCKSPFATNDTSTYERREHNINGFKEGFPIQSAFLMIYVKTLGTLRPRLIMH